MSQKKQAKEEIRQRILENLSWEIAERNDHKVAKALYEGEEVDAVHGLGEVGLLDDFWSFLQETGLMAMLEGTKIPGIKRIIIPVIKFIMLYMLRILFGIKSMNALPDLLFSNEGAMKVVGFNGQQIQEGTNRRGDSKRKEKAKSGPLSPECLADNICKMPESLLSKIFNRAISLLAKFGLFGAEVTVIIDGTQLPTTEKYEGRGVLEVTERKRKKEGGWVTVVDWIYGWKLIALMEARTRVPLALKVVKIQAYEGEWIVPLVKQAQQNLGDFARIVKVAGDRAYLDGDDLWQLHDECNVIFVVIAKSNMRVRKDAVAQATQVPDEQVAQRTRTLRHGHGRYQTTEERTTRLVGLPKLTTYGQYGPPAETQHYRRKDYQANPINGVVVLEWDGRDSNHVYLTNGPVDDPFIVFDDYDQRSLIENGLFRESKGAWHLINCFPKRNAQGVISHVYFTMLVLALATAFRLWHKAQSKPPDSLAPDSLPDSSSPHPLDYNLLNGEGSLRWRRRLHHINRDKVIVFFGNLYGIFHIAEFMVLLGLRLKHIPPDLGQPSDILARFGLLDSS